MALQQTGNNVIDDYSNGTFTRVTVSSNGIIEIPDANTTLGIGSAAIIAKRPIAINVNNAMWSWWTKPVTLRDVNTTNNWTYSCFTHSNGAVGLAVTNNLTRNTTAYTITSSGLFGPDDHNAGSVAAGNGKVAIFIQGRNVANANVLNPNNMFYIQFDEGTTPAGRTLQNITFSYEASATASFYPNSFNANGDFFLFGRQTQLATANQWIYARSTWPLTTFQSPQPFFKSTFTWPYFAIRRSILDPYVFNFALGWHPYDSTSNNSIYFGKILYNGNTAKWDVFSNNAVIGNMTTGTGLPFNESVVERVYLNSGANNSVRLFDSHDDAVAFGTFNKGPNIVTYNMAYKANGVWTTYPVCIGGRPFHGTDVRDYYGGMAIDERNKYIVTCSVERNNVWFIEEYQTADFGNNWTLNYSTQAALGNVAARPMYEVLSEDSHIYYKGAHDTLACLSWFGTYNTANFSIFSTNLISTRSPLYTNNVIDMSSNAYMTYCNVNANSYFEVTSNAAIAAYTGAGQTPTLGQNITSIERFSMINDLNATSVGNFTGVRVFLGFSGSSETHGYIAGQNFGFSSDIEKFKFGSDVTSIIAGHLQEPRGQGSGCNSPTNMYVLGGWPFTNPPVLASAAIERFPFANEGMSVYAGALSEARRTGAGANSLTHGYTIAGAYAPLPGSVIINVNTVDKFPFASVATATDVGDTTELKRSHTGHQSPVAIYSSGGINPVPVQSSRIEKMLFASEGNMTYIADLTVARTGHSGHTSSTHGYAAGGGLAPLVFNVIDKFPFASDSNATDVADLIQGRRGASMHSGTM
jgi:hypothetical protein